MERIVLSDNPNGVVLDTNNYIVSNAKQLSFVIKQNNSINLLINGISENALIDINIEEGASLTISFLSTKEFGNLKFLCKCKKDSSVTGYFADFSEGKNFGDVQVDLNEEGSSCVWHLASLSSKKDNKRFDVSVNHNASNTNCQLDNYGVCKDEAKLIFSGICSVIKGSSRAEAHQNAKIMVFDEKSNAIAKPILKIDENDVIASHAAIVGKINDDHLFYLTSRGLTEAEAKELITYGYLKPILNGFNDDSIKDEINGLIEGRM